MSKSLCLFASLATAVCLLVSRDAGAFDVTACAQTVPAGEVGVLQTDLDCPYGIESIGVTLRADSVLDLNGRTLSGGQLTVLCAPAEQVGTCTIHGPGVVSGGEIGIQSGFGVKRLIVEDATVSDHTLLAVNVSDGRRTRIVLTNVAIDRNGSEAGGAYLAAVNNTKKLTLRNVTATGNFATVFSAAKIMGIDVALDGNGRGMDAGNARLENASITNSAGIALFAIRRVALKRSTLSNNDTLGDGIDILSTKRPRLEEATCSRSQVCSDVANPPGFPPCYPEPLVTWGVCTNDF